MMGTTNMDFTAIVVEHYGPIAFGLIAVVILWRVVVAPTMRENRVDRETMEQAMTTTKSIAEANRAAAELCNSTAATLAATAGVLDRCLTSALKLNAQQQQRERTGT